MSKPKIINFLKKSKSVTSFVEQVCNWFFAFNWIDVEGFSIQRGGGTVRLAVQIPPQEESTKYNGPFLVEKKDSTNVVVGKARDREVNPVKDYAIIGIITKDFTAKNELSCTTTGYVVLKLTVVNNVYTWTHQYHTSSSLPEQTTSLIYFPLAYVICKDAKISQIIQLQYGIIHYPARFI